VKEIEFRPTAIVDIDASSDFYALVEGEVGGRWVAAIKKLIGEISRRPSFGSAAYAAHLTIEGLRHRQVPRFPYLLFYVELHDVISVVRVLHERRDVAFEFEDGRFEPD
jgi:toxin ParE1/3/4